MGRGDGYGVSSFGTYCSPVPFFPVLSVYGPCAFLPFSSPGELWREAVAEARAGLGNVSGGAWVSEWSCFRCTLPPAPDGDIFDLGACRIRRVRTALAPAWQAGKLPGVFDV